MKASGQLHDAVALPPPRKISPGTHWVGGWVGPRAGLDAVSKRKIPSPRWESNPDHQIAQPVVSRHTDWAIPASTNTFMGFQIPHACYMSRPCHWPVHDTFFIPKIKDSLPQKYQRGWTENHHVMKGLRKTMNRQDSRSLGRDSISLIRRIVAR
jgi:hypothetical protein